MVGSRSVSQHGIACMHRHTLYIKMVHVRYDDVRTPCCSSSARVDYNQQDPCYVFKATCNRSSRAIAASVSSNIIKTYSPTNVQLTHVGDLKGHRNTITDVAFTLPENPSMLHSSSTDGTVRGWDLRSGQQVEGFQTTQELFSFSVCEHMLTAGGQGEVLFWDRRTGQPAAKLEDTHMEDVTQVKFHPSSRHVISASIDGLIAVHSMAGSVEDDDNFVAALNVGTSVEQLGTYGPNGEKMWVRTGTETLHLWEWLSATSDVMEGGNGPFADLSQAREDAVQAASTAGVAPMLPEVHYLAGCHYDTLSNQLILMAGHEGSIGFFPLTEQAASSSSGGSTGAALFPPIMLLHGVHTDVVRSVEVFGDGSSGPFCLTGGEDAQLCLWSMDQPATAPAVATPAAAALPVATQVASSGPLKEHDGKQRHSKLNRKHSPY